MEGEIKTFKDLLNELQKLSPDELSQNCSILIDDESFAKPVNSIFKTEDDIYVNKDDSEDGGTIKELEDLHGDDFEIKDYILGTEKGRVFLYSSDENI